MKKLDLGAIEQVTFPDNQYYKSPLTKNQIYLHHTASGKGLDGDIKYWLSTASRIATALGIEFDGNIVQFFSSKYWGHHLGIKGKVFAKYGLRNLNVSLNQRSIGIEIDSWGPLAKVGKSYYSWVGTKVPAKEVMKYTEPFKHYPDSEFFRKHRVVGFDCYYYQKYTKAQIESTRQLLVFFNEKYNIPLEYNEDIWDVTVRALEGDPGVFTHNSVRIDKTDVHPQPDLIKMLKSLCN